MSMGREMSYSLTDRSVHWPWWRILTIAIGTLALCACRANKPALPPVSHGASLPTGAAAQQVAAPQQLQPMAPHPLYLPTVVQELTPAAHSPIQTVAYQQPLPDAGDPPVPGNAAPGQNLAGPQEAEAYDIPPDDPWHVDPDLKLADIPYHRARQIPYPIAGAWAPPGLALPWPYDEYLRDGGDRRTPARVRPDWVIEGLQPEDTIGHFDTLVGQTIVEPSNRVHIYAPRFASVRSMNIPEQKMHTLNPADVYFEEKLVRYDDLKTPVARIQTDELISMDGTKHANIYRTDRQNGMVSKQQPALEFAVGYLPYEDLHIMRRGEFLQTEKARLAVVREAAITWSQNQEPEVLIEGQRAAETVLDRHVGVTYTYDLPGPPKLRVIKVASTQVALPGDLVDFTIRYDNIGDSVMGNVTIVDNLTTRLEYVPGSAQSSLDANFLTQPNDVGSVVVRWEITDPLEAGEGGIVRFQCRVR